MINMHIPVLPTTQNGHLIKLVESMTKAEKRNFKLYVNRIGGKENAKFIQLFDVLDKQKEYEEDQICKKIPSLEKNIWPI